jgi:hypothetical protein
MNSTDPMRYLLQKWCIQVKRRILPTECSFGRDSSSHADEHGFKRLEWTEFDRPNAIPSAKVMHPGKTTDLANWMFFWTRFIIACRETRVQAIRNELNSTDPMWYLQQKWCIQVKRRILPTKCSFCRDSPSDADEHVFKRIAKTWIRPTQCDT